MRRNERFEAIQTGALHYFTGKPCKKGHVAPRRTVNGNCTVCEGEKNNAPERKAYMSQYAEENRDKVREIASRWQKNNPGKVNANTSLRHTAKMQRQPKWLTKSDKLRIKAMYQLAAMRSRDSFEKWHVDHIVPLQGENVSGLHVPWNLRVIPAVENIRKGNRIDDTRVAAPPVATSSMAV